MFWSRHWRMHCGSAGEAVQKHGTSAPEETPLEEANRGPSWLAMKGSTSHGPDFAHEEESVEP
eukprot:9554167-Heterocapsa_arctica.AAC.1